MTFLLGRDGKLSIFRLSLLGAAIGGLFILGSIISLTLETASRQTPLEIQLPQGAVERGTRPYTDQHREVYYTVPGADTDTIGQFYQDRLDELYGTTLGSPNRVECERFPEFGNHPDYDPVERPESPPFYIECMFDRSYLGNTQYTQVTIYPGVPNEDPNLSTEGSVVIIYEQRWTP